MSKINQELIGTWWAFRSKGIYALHRGNDTPSRNGTLPSSAITKWYYPHDPFNLRQEVNSHRDKKLMFDCSNINFPPDDYLDDDSITEIQILSNGDYRIIDSDPIKL